MRGREGKNYLKNMRVEKRGEQVQRQKVGKMYFKKHGHVNLDNVEWPTATNGCYKLRELGN